jgi:hypothetical protein
MIRDPVTQKIPPLNSTKQRGARACIAFALEPQAANARMRFPTFMRQLIEITEPRCDALTTRLAYLPQ